MATTPCTNVNCSRLSCPNAHVTRIICKLANNSDDFVFPCKHDSPRTDYKSNQEDFENVMTKIINILEKSSEEWIKDIGYSFIHASNYEPFLYPNDKQIYYKGKRSWSDFSKGKHYAGVHNDKITSYWMLAYNVWCTTTSTFYKYVYKDDAWSNDSFALCRDNATLVVYKFKRPFWTMHGKVSKTGKVTPAMSLCTSFTIRNIVRDNDKMMKNKHILTTRLSSDEWPFEIFRKMNNAYKHASTHDEGHASLFLHMNNFIRCLLSYHGLLTEPYDSIKELKQQNRHMIMCPYKFQETSSSEINSHFFSNRVFDLSNISKDFLDKLKKYTKEWNKNKGLNLF